MRKGCVISLKERLDLLLTRRGYYPSREKARAAIMAGLVYINRQISDKPGMSVDAEAEVEIRDTLCPYVGRGGLKLEKAIREFSLDINGLTAIDIGASTGGFTDCMLKHGAAKVYAIDVGYGQLDYKLRSDSRVITMERTNIRHLDTDSFPEQADFISIDVSFISLNLVFPVAARLLSGTGKLVCLIKPQFEAGREQVGKHGIVREAAIHKEVIEKVIRYGLAAGLIPEALTWSPMTGAKGNIEYLMFFTKGAGQPDSPAPFNIEEIVSAAHQNL